jgi:hypothetical protein
MGEEGGRVVVREIAPICESMCWLARGLLFDMHLL